MNRTLNTLQKAFLLRSCSDSVYETRTRPCMLHQIKRCSAPCTGLISLEDYGELVTEAEQFLRGKSRAVIGFWLAHCMARPQMLDQAMGELLPMVADGSLRPVSGGRYPLSAVREAHQDILSRRTTGKLSLDPRR